MTNEATQANKTSAEVIEHADGGQDVSRPEVLEPFGWIGDWFEHWPPMFGRRVPELFERGAGAVSAMRVEQYADGDESVIRAEMPGVDPDEDIDISVVGDKLTISAKREQRSESKSDSGFRSEFHYGSFRRVVSLPAGTNIDDVKATYHDGILEVRVPTKGTAETTTKVPIGRR